VQNVVGDQAEVRVLMKPNADPHSFEISAQDGAMMRQADLIVTNGLGLEEGLQQHIDSAQSADVPVLVAGDVIEPLAYTEGEAEGAMDPHFWTDPATNSRYGHSTSKESRRKPSPPRQPPTGPNSGTSTQP
jgi:zinc/manganese transport system substrate-binding protein